MPTNTKTKAEKAAIKRRQRARKKNGELTPAAASRSVDLLQGMIDDPKADPKVQAIARLAQRNLGAPTKLRPAVASRILKYVVEGNFIKTACAAVGVAPSTFKNWMERAELHLTEAERKYEAAVKAAEADESTEADEDSEKTEKQASAELSVWSFVPPEELIYVHLHIGLTMAEARGEMRLLQKAAKGERGWQAALAVLERRYSDNWQKQEKKTHVVEGDADKPVVITYESDAERQERVARILGRAGAVDSLPAPSTGDISPGMGDAGEVVDATVVEDDD